MTENALVPFQPPVIKGRWSRLIEWAFPRPKSSLANLPASATLPQEGVGLFTLVNVRAGFVAKSNSNTYRAFSEASPWVRAAIDILRDAISSAEWDIVPIDKSGPKNVRLQKRIRDLLTEPNPGDTFWSFMQKAVEDLCVLDASATEKVRYPDGELAELYPTMGENIWVNARWDGSDPDQTRYIWVPDGVQRAEYTNADMMYLMQNPRTNSAVGLSPLEVLKKTIDSELQAMEYNRRQVMGAPPEGVLNIGESAMREDVQAARTYWDSEVLGQSSFAIIGGYKAPSWMKFRDTNEEMQFVQWQELLVRCIAVVFGLSPMDLGITYDINRSTAEQSAENSEGRGIRPLMSMLQNGITRNVVQDASFGGKSNNLGFVFTALNLKESKSRADINKLALGSTPWKTVNEARIMDGRAPLGDPADEDNVFNSVLALSPKGLLDITHGRFIGEEDLTSIQSDAQISVEQAKAEARAANPTKVQPADVASGAPKTTD